MRSEIFTSRGAPLGPVSRAWKVFAWDLPLMSQVFSIFKGRESTGSGSQAPLIAWDSTSTRRGNPHALKREHRIRSRSEVERPRSSR
jgi:hypothetical protein